MAPDSELSQHWDEEQEQDAGVEDEDAGVEEVALEEAEDDILEEVHTLAELEKKIF